jgi:hypothetical protein
VGAPGPYGRLIKTVVMIVVLIAIFFITITLVTFISASLAPHCTYGPCP